jgi:hypothetical protein
VFLVECDVDIQSDYLQDPWQLPSGFRLHDPRNVCLIFRVFLVENKITAIMNHRPCYGGFGIALLLIQLIALCFSGSDIKIRLQR